MTSGAIHYQLVRVAERRYRWRLVGGNGRPLGVSASETSGAEQCLDALSRLRALLPDATVHYQRDGNRAMTWSVRLHGDEVAVAPRGYARSVEVETSAARFLEWAGKALVTPRITTLDQPQHRYRPHTPAGRLGAHALREDA